jgi:hypothetical protein
VMEDLHSREAGQEPAGDPHIGLLPVGTVSRATHELGIAGRFEDQARYRRFSVSAQLEQRLAERRERAEPPLPRTTKPR